MAILPLPHVQQTGVKNGRARRNAVHPTSSGAVWCAVVRCGAAWRGALQCRVAWCAVVPRGVARCGVVCVGWHGVV